MKMIDRVKQDFLQNLSGFDLTTLEESELKIYGLSPEFRLIYFNPAFMHPLDKQEQRWKHYLKELLGVPIQNVLQGPIKDLYLERFQKVLHRREPLRNQYECSDSKKYRLYQMDIYPLKEGKGIIVSNALRVENVIHNQTAQQAMQEHYTDENGLITQCSNCHKVQRPQEPNVWDWVPYWADKIPDNCSHSICPICFDYHWKGA